MMIANILLSAKSKLPYGLAWKRLKHRRFGHPFSKSVAIDKLRSDKHPANDAEYIYTINIRKCLECGLIFHDSGMELRHREKHKKQRGE